MFFALGPEGDICDICFVLRYVMLVLSPMTQISHSGSKPSKCCLCFYYYDEITVQLTKERRLDPRSGDSLVRGQWNVKFYLFHRQRNVFKQIELKVWKRNFHHLISLPMGQTLKTFLTVRASSCLWATVTAEFKNKENVTNLVITISSEWEHKHIQEEFNTFLKVQFKCVKCLLR